MDDKRVTLLNELCSAFQLKSYMDFDREITRKDGAKAIHKIKKLKNKILDLYPYSSTLKLRSGVITARDSITCLSQILKAHNMRVIPTQRRIYWDKKEQKTRASYNYKIIG
jgi:hypothetical protein